MKKRESRELEERSTPFFFDQDEYNCQFGYTSCPAYGSFGGAGYMDDFVCVDLRNDLESCGGCVSDDSPNGEFNRNGGRDCSAIPNIDTVSCQKGQCIIGEFCVANFGMSC